ncbi:hypothetical protein AMECASPLE_034495 [Ameca splendens]|uniref:Uncharacterized protein n=1 Tax=Ameca splendens TaxID=208324 RepID=A0ABV0Y6Z2_9TELE
MIIIIITHEYMFCFKPFHCSSGFMFRVVFLLEGEPPPQYLLQTRKVFFQDCPVFGSIHLSSTMTTFPVAAEEKHPQSMMLPPPYLRVGMVCSEGCAVLVLCHT